MKKKEAVEQIKRLKQRGEKEAIHRVVTFLSVFSKAFCTGIILNELQLADKAYKKNLVELLNIIQNRMAPKPTPSWRPMLLAFLLIVLWAGLGCFWYATSKWPGQDISLIRALFYHNNMIVPLACATVHISLRHRALLFA